MPSRPIKMTLKEVHDNALRQTAALGCRFRALCGWLAKGRCEGGRDSAALRLRHLGAARGGPGNLLGSCSRRSFGPLACFRYPSSGERAPRSPDNQNSQLLAQPAAWSQKGCGEDENRKPSTTPFVNPCRSAFYCVSLQTGSLTFEHFWAIFGPRFLTRRRHEDQEKCQFQAEGLRKEQRPFPD